MIPAAKPSLDLDVFYKYHLVHLSKITEDSPAEYCIKPRHKRHRQDFMNDFPLASLQQLIDTYRSNAQAGRLNLGIDTNLPAPFTEAIFINYPQLNVPTAQRRLPVVLRAVIYGSNIRQDVPVAGSRGGQRIPSNIRNRMEAIGRVHDPVTNSLDEAGHLLAYQLGGGIDNWFNYLPMMARLNRAINNENSAWYYEEIGIRNFLTTHQDGWVEWNLMVHYDGSGNGSARPIGFCLQHTDYNAFGNGTPSQEMCFSNDPAHECLYDEN